MATSYPLDLAGSAAGSAIKAGQTAASQLPGYMTSMGNIGTNIASETAGQVPQDVINQLKQQGAESNVTTGAGSNAAYLKSLGLTSLGLQEQGQKDLESILPSTPGYTLSQNPEFQTSSNLAYEQQLQPQIWARQDQQQQLALQQQQLALAAAKSGLNTGGGWAAPTNTWSGSVATDALGFPNTSTATLPGQTSASGVTNPWGGPQTVVAYGPGGGPATAALPFSDSAPAADTSSSDYYDDFGYGDWGG
jgi:hypothetical protein